LPALVSPQRISHTVVRDVDVLVAVVVVVSGDDAERVARFRECEAGLARGVREGAVPVVAVDHVLDGYLPERPAIDRNGSIGAVDAVRGLGGPAGRAPRAVDDVVADVDVEVSVVVHVEEGRGGAPVVGPADSGLFGDVGEGPVTVVAQEHVRPEVRHVEIGIAVVVVVADGHAVAPATVPHAGLVRHLGETTVPDAAIKPVRLPFAGGAVVSGAVHDVEVELAVAVVVEPGSAGAHRLVDPTFLARNVATDVVVVDAGRFRRIGETGRGERRVRRAGDRRRRA